MFAGGMIPTDDAFFQNVKQEVIEQVQRLRKYRCIVLWCGNNEIDEAWHQWGWKKSFEKDSVQGKRLWDAYTRLFRDSIAQWVKEKDGIRPYISSSPQYGWGNENSYRSGDSHYWGLWWGLKPVSVFAEKTGRFVSEYGMQAMPDFYTSRSSLPADQQYLFSPALRVHQKHPTGFENLQHYLHLYLLDSNLIRKLSLHDYTYLTQCLQYYVLEQAIAYHLQAPQNSGTLVWQWNDCWPVCSWSVTDAERRPKAGWYALKKAYTASPALKPDPTLPRDRSLQKAQYRIRILGGDTLEMTAINRLQYVYGYGTQSYVELSDNYFNLEAGETKRLKLSPEAMRAHRSGQLKWKTYNEFQNLNAKKVGISGN
jgi:beta-mannosidase